MGRGKMSHDWNLFSPLICYVANPWLEKKHRLTPEKVNPFWEKTAKKAKPFRRSDWRAFGAAIRGEG